MLGFASSAWAQAGAGGGTLGLGGSTKPEGTGGVMVGDGVYLRVGVAAEAGYDTNVFYNDEERVDSATLQITPSIELNNNPREGAGRPPVSFTVGATLLYREYLTEDVDVKAQRAFNPAFSAGLSYSGGSAGVSLSDQFVRMEDPPYQRGSSPLTRDYNLATLQGSLAPGGGRVTLNLRYINALDFFESDEFDYANRMSQDGTVDLSWRWLPKTSLFLAVGVGHSHYLSDKAEAAGKSDSIPYRVMGGLRGLVTARLALTISAGFADAIYDNSAVNPNGFSNLTATVAGTYTVSEWTALAASYMHEFRDSPVLGSYYDLDGFDLGVNQRVGPFQLGLAGRYEFRRYRGFQTVQMLPVSRNDHIYQFRLQGDYNVQRWFYVGFSYLTIISRTTEDTSLASMQQQVGDLDFGKHIILGRVGVTY